MVTADYEVLIFKYFREPLNQFPQLSRPDLMNFQEIENKFEDFQGLLGALEIQ